MNDTHKIILKYYIPPLTAAEQKVSWFCTVARISSSRYMAWLSASFTLITGLFYGILYLLGRHSSLSHSILYFVNRGIFIIYLLLLAATCSYISMKRLQDFNASKWWGLMMFLPIINCLMLLLLIAIPGTKSNNKFGEPPTITTKLEWLFIGWFWLLAISTLWGAILLSFWLTLNEQVAPQIVNLHSSYLLKQTII